LSAEPLIVDFRSVIRSINHPVVRFLPSWVLDGICRYLGQEEMQTCLKACENLQGFDWAKGVLDHFQIRVEATGLENVETCGRAVFTPNHPLGGLDGLAVLTMMGRYYPKAKSLSSSFLMVIPNVRSFIIPVGDAYLSSKIFARKVDELFASDEQVLCFAAGQVAQRHSGQIVDPPWTKSFISKAIQSGRSVVPVFIDARNSDSFYRTHRLRQFLIYMTKLKLERYALLRETFRHRNEVFRLHFGTPIPASTFDERYDHDGWAQQVRAHVHRMRWEPDAPFSPC
jgi:hypothetical protein